MSNIGNSPTNISKIRLAEQGSDPGAAAAGFWYVYTKSDGLYVEDDAGNVYGPFAQSGTPGLHATQHENGGSDELNLAGMTGLLATAQTPATHATEHESGGGDAIKLDDLAAPDDNTDLDASITTHGLLPKLDNNAAHYLDGQGGWTSPPTGLTNPMNDEGDMIYGGAAGVPTELELGTEGYILTAGASAPVWAAPLGAVTDIRDWEIVLDGGGQVLTTGVKVAIRVKYACTITAWSLGSPKESGAIKVDVWKDTHANFPPTDADSITNGHEPEITATGNIAEDTNLGDWSDVTVDTGDWLIFNIDSVTTITLATLVLHVTRTG